MSSSVKRQYFCSACILLMPCCNNVHFSFSYWVKHCMTVNSMGPWTLVLLLFSFYWNTYGEFASTGCFLYRGSKSLDKSKFVFLTRFSWIWFLDTERLSSSPANNFGGMFGTTLERCLENLTTPWVWMIPWNINRFSNLIFHPIWDLGCYTFYLVIKCVAIVDWTDNPWASLHQLWSEVLKTELDRWIDRFNWLSVSLYHLINSILVFDF